MKKSGKVKWILTKCVCMTWKQRLHWFHAIILSHSLFSSHNNSGNFHHFIPCSGNEHTRTHTIWVHVAFAHIQFCWLILFMCFFFLFVDLFWWIVSALNRNVVSHTKTIPKDGEHLTFTVNFLVCSHFEMYIKSLTRKKTQSLYLCVCVCIIHAPIEINGIQFCNINLKTRKNTCNENQTIMLLMLFQKTSFFDVIDSLYHWTEYWSWAFIFLSNDTFPAICPTKLVKTQNKQTSKQTEPNCTKPRQDRARATERECEWKMILSSGESNCSLILTWYKSFEIWFPVLKHDQVQMHAANDSKIISNKWNLIS